MSAPRPPPGVRCSPCNMRVAMKDWGAHKMGKKHWTAARVAKMTKAELQAHDAEVDKKIPSVIPKAVKPKLIVKDDKVYPVPFVTCKMCEKDVAMKDWASHIAGRKHAVAASETGIPEADIAAHDDAITTSIPSPIPSAKDWAKEQKEEEKRRKKQLSLAPSPSPSTLAAALTEITQTPNEERVCTEEDVKEHVAASPKLRKSRGRKTKKTVIDISESGFTVQQDLSKPVVDKRILESLNSQRNKHNSVAPLLPFTTTVKVTVPAAALTLEGIGLEMNEDSLVVAKVAPDSPAELGGLIPTMVLMAVNDVPMSNLVQCGKYLNTNTATQLTVEVLADSSKILKGKVREWLPDKGIAFITPELPVFLQAGLMGSTTAVYFGDVFYRCEDDEGLNEDDDVEFSAVCVNDRLTARDVSCTARQQSSKNTTKGLRAGADIASLVMHMQKHKATPVKRICMMFAGGKCPDARKASCANGLHISFEAKCAEFKDTIPIKEPSEAHTYMSFAIKPSTYVDVCAQKAGLAEIKAEKDSGHMTLKKDGKVYPAFASMDFASQGDVKVSFPDIKESVDFPLSKAPVLLGRMKCMAENAGVKHNIPDELQRSNYKQDIMVEVNETKLELLKQKWEDRMETSCCWWAGGAQQRSTVIKAWQLTNEALEFRFRATEYNMTQEYRKAPDMIEGFHGTHENNVLSIARHGLDPLRRSGQVFGEGEYFAKNPAISMGYCSGGGYMFLCKLILGKQDVDHTYVDQYDYYIMKQRQGNIQAMPMYLIQWGPPTTRLCKQLRVYSRDDQTSEAFLRRLGEQQRGGVEACRGRVNGGMSAASTKHLWLGWLEPTLVKDEAVLKKDVTDFLEGHEVAEVISDRNGARVGAYVLLVHKISQIQVASLNNKKYRDSLRISVDDAQPGNPWMASKPCPLLKGPGGYCRGSNLRGHTDWTKVCSFRHDARDSLTFDASLRYESIPDGSAKYNELATEVGRLGRVTRVRRIVNAKLEKAYESRRAFLNEKHGSIIEKELWHGTACKALDQILQKGLQCPADSCAAKECSVSGGKGLCTTLCDTNCNKCVKPHKWERCHMFGLGIYLADSAEKSHRYVRPHDDNTYSLVRCRVNLGSPYLVKANLLTQNALHDFVNCSDPSKHLDNIAVPWDHAQSHESFYVKGLGAAHKYGYGVMNSEYIVFQPYQVLPLYVVDYEY
eukprot:TRINITY_DN1263_c1_g4_i2.p1 TRINITY_DN1263_c1_g4~~TRINITY_DN1263_c1_g4_i2.p1  ORF type:complete len:1212 (+),score=312.10 TRINITY_DN1263_c1_g4_i2:65-3637(+)